MQALSVPERFEGASRREYPGIPMHAITSVYCCSSLVRQISVPSLAYRRLRGDAIEVYKYLKGIYRVDSSRMLPLAGLKTFETRGHLLKIQKRYCRTKLRANFFSFRIVNMWNGLPDDVVLSPTLNSFKGRIDRHWRSLRYSVFWLCLLMIWLNWSDLISPKVNNGLLQPWLQHDDDEYTCGYIEAICCLPLQ